MARDRLVIFDDAHVWRIGWHLTEDNDIGVRLGEERSLARPDDEASAAEWERYIAHSTVAIMPEAHRDELSVYWESYSAAAKALKAVKLAIANHKRPMPEWAQKALDHGWKPPKKGAW